MNISNIDSSFNMPSQGMNSHEVGSQRTQRAEHSEDFSPKNASELNKKNEAQIKKELNKTVENLNSLMDKIGTDLKFAFNDKIDMMYVNVHEKSSGRLIRKFPTEEAMKLAEHMKEFVGMLFDEKG